MIHARHYCPVFIVFLIILCVVQCFCLHCFDTVGLASGRESGLQNWVMKCCLERGANDLHMVQLMPLQPHHLLLHWNIDWFLFTFDVWTSSRCQFVVVAAWTWLVNNVSRDVRRGCDSVLDMILRHYLRCTCTYIHTFISVKGNGENITNKTVMTNVRS